MIRWARNATAPNRPMQVKSMLYILLAKTFLHIILPLKMVSFLNHKKTFKLLTYILSNAIQALFSMHPWLTIMPHTRMIAKVLRNCIEIKFQTLLGKALYCNCNCAEFSRNLYLTSQQIELLI